jgi:hypothetical protein
MPVKNIAEVSGPGFKNIYIFLNQSANFVMR